MEKQPQTVVYRDGGRVYARLAGAVNRDTIPYFQERLERAAAGECRTLALDLGGADYLDSDGIRWLQRLQEALAARQVELRLSVRAGSRIERTLRLVQLDRVFSLERYPEDTPQRAPSHC